jgi:hypothetical protein
MPHKKPIILIALGGNALILPAAASKCIKIAEIKMHDLFDEAVWVAGSHGGSSRR